MPPATRKLDQLTVTRFIAALSVLLFHGGRELGVLRYLPMLTSGPTAVGYFYVLSGFVMALAYYRPGVRFDFRNYWLARFSRIYPVYIISFVLTCLYYLELMSKLRSEKILANIFLYQAWIPKYALSFNIAAWSLSVEAFFYVIFPFLLILAMRQPVKRLIWISLGFWIISQLTHSILTMRFMPEMESWLAYFPLFHLNAFLLGVAGGIWYTANPAHQQADKAKNIWLLIGALGFVLLMLSLREFMPAFPRTFSLDTGLLAPFFLIIILALATDTTRLSRGLSHPWLVLLGNASYALYILHVPFRWILERFLADMGSTIPYNVMYLVYAPTSIVICVFVYKYIERPARDWLRTHTHVLPWILLDIILITTMTWLSFTLRLGAGISGFVRTQTFALRVGLVVFFLFMLIFRFYTTNSWRSLAPAILSGTVVLAGFIYYASTKGWVENFSRSIVLLIPILIFSSIYLSRSLFRFLRPKQLSKT
ncbi:MAG: acyltransferase family protein [Chloroflexota bacterium]